MLRPVVVFMFSVSISGALLAAGTSPYAGEEAREIKALSPSDIDGLIAGRGMGYAMAAELNGYPGPAHVLELAEQLELTADIGVIEARLRAAHLNAHLQQTRILSHHQIARYITLRGYDNGHAGHGHH